MKNNRLSNILQLALSGLTLPVHNAILYPAGEKTITSTAGEGIAVNVAGAAVNATTVPAFLVTSIDTNDAQRKVVPWNFDGEVEVKLKASGAGSIVAGSLLMLNSDGTALIDAGTGARVVCYRAMEDKVSDGELLRARLVGPFSYAS